MTTRAEQAVIRATDEGENGVRVFYRNALEASGKRIPQFRVEPAGEGEFFVEEALAGGRFWQRRAYGITEGGDGISADNIPDHIWAKRKERAESMAQAVAKMRAAGLDPTRLNYAEVDVDESLDEETRQAVATYRMLRWILAWPAEAVAEHIDAYHRQWSEPAEEAQAEG